MKAFTYCGLILFWAYLGIIVIYLGIKRMGKYRRPTKRELKMAEKYEKRRST